MAATFTQLYEMQKLNWVSIVTFAIEVAGSGAELARLMDVSPSAIYQWQSGAGIPSTKNREFLVKYLDDNGKMWTHTGPEEEHGELVKTVGDGMKSQTNLLHIAVDLVQQKFNIIVLLGIVNLAATIAIGACILLHMRKLGAL